MQLRDLAHVLDRAELHALHLLRVELLRWLHPALEHQRAHPVLLPVRIPIVAISLAVAVLRHLLIRVRICRRLPLHAVGVRGAGPGGGRFVLLVLFFAIRESFEIGEELVCERAH